MKKLFAAIAITASITNPTKGTVVTDKFKAKELWTRISYDFDQVTGGTTGIGVYYLPIGRRVIDMTKIGPGEVLSGTFTISNGSGHVSAIPVVEDAHRIKLEIIDLDHQDNVFWSDHVKPLNAAVSLKGYAIIPVKQ